MLSLLSRRGSRLVRCSASAYTAIPKQSLINTSRHFCAATEVFPRSLVHDGAEVKVVDSQETPKKNKNKAKKNNPNPSVVTTNTEESTSNLLVDTEDVLMAHTDPFGLISTKFNPAIVRAFKDSRLIKTKNQSFKGATKVTEKALLALNKKISRASLDTMQVSYLPPSVESARVRAEQDFVRTFRTLRTDDELKAITSFMAILLPRSPHLWNEFDRFISQRFTSNPVVHLELALLAAYAFHRSKTSYGNFLKDKTMVAANHNNTNNNQQQQSNKKNNAISRTSQAVVQFLVDVKKQQQQSSASSTTAANSIGASFASDQNVFEIFSDDNVFQNNTTEVFAPVGVLQARDNRAVEILGLQLNLMANHHHLLPEGVKRQILQDLTNHCLKVLSSTHTPVKLSTLREVWENAPKIALPNAYSMYKQLYQQVIYSISTEPLQIIHQEDGICTLFESMIASRFKSSQCISKLHELVSSRGMDYQRVGVRLFNALVQLESISFATMILENMMKNSSMKLEYIFTQSSKGKPFSLSDAAKEQVYKTLQESLLQNYHEGQTSLSSSSSGENEFHESHVGHLVKKKTSDLVLALFCFNREEKKTSYYKLLEQMEISLLPHIAQGGISLNEAIGLLHSYALSGRLQGGMMNAIDHIVRENLSKMNSKQLSTIIWTCARLNYQPDYLKAVISQYFHEMESIKSLSTAGAYALSRTLWSLAVLQLLDIPRFQSVQNLLLKSSQLLKGVEMHSWMIKQLTQIHAELMTQAKNQGVEDAVIQEQLKGLEDFFKSSAAHKNLNKRILRENLSSWTHMDASRVLTDMGIAHENEKLLSNGYVVDIFIPASQTFGQDHGGIAMEFDGPSHFESYLNVRTFSNLNFFTS